MKTPGIQAPGSFCPRSWPPPQTAWANTQIGDYCRESGVFGRADYAVAPGFIGPNFITVSRQIRAIAWPNKVACNTRRYVCKVPRVEPRPWTALGGSGLSPEAGVYMLWRTRQTTLSWTSVILMTLLIARRPQSLSHTCSAATLLALVVMDIFLYVVENRPFKL
jgi:hypothetical protein